ncbi:MAG: gephyrin-like molybdotransferase Glp, partial [Magnetospiraceae bacterium]
MTIARNSCFDAFEGMMPLEEALGRLKAAVGPIDRVETLPLSEAGGRVLAEDVISPMDVPPHNNAAVDGYAVFHEDLMPGGETRLPVTGRVAAGHALSRMPRKGEALRIFTGAPVPEGPDTIIMQEDAQEENGDVLLNPGVKRGANLRSAGEDIQVGATILRTGHLIRPQDVGYVASVGRADVRVYSRPRVAVFSTGDEVLEPGQRLTPGGIYDANRFAIAAVLRGMGCVVTDLGILPDSLEIIAKALGNAALEHDLIITSGGVSMGDEDHVKAAVESQGALHFWRVAIKPGRPIALGQVADTPFIGLPGNPVAALVTFLRMGRMLVARLAG